MEGLIAVLDQIARGALPPPGEWTTGRTCRHCQLAVILTGIGWCHDESGLYYCPSPRTTSAEV